MFYCLFPLNGTLDTISNFSCQTFTALFFLTRIGLLPSSINHLVLHIPYWFEDLKMYFLWHNWFLITLQIYSEKLMAPHSSILAWKIPWTEEPGRLQSMGSLRLRHDRATSLSLFTFMHWRRKWQPTPVFLPGESQGWGSLVGCCLWDRKEFNLTEVT